MQAEVILNKCGTVGKCVQICPEVFQFQPGHKKAVVISSPVPKMFEEDCRRAAEACPNDAILIRD